MRILYRSDGSTARADLSEEPWRTELEPQEREVMTAFLAALPNLPETIPLADGIGSYSLTSTGKWNYDDLPTMYAEYGWYVDAQSLLPWDTGSEPTPSRKRKFRPE
jgi:hypothetical protein